MKLILPILLLVMLASCSTVKKNTLKSHISYDSTSKKSGEIISVSKKDSSGSGTIVKTELKTVNGDYKKQVTVKEYFSDELDIDGDSSLIKAKVDSILPKKKSNPVPVLRYRETTTVIEGNISSQNSITQKERQSAKVNSVDSISKLKQQATDVHKDETVKTISKVKSKFLPGFTLFLFLGLLAYGCFRFYVDKFFINR